MEFRAQDLRLRIYGVRLRVQGLGFRGWIHDLGLCALGFKVSGLGFRVQGLGFGF